MTRSALLLPSPEPPSCACIGSRRRGWILLCGRAGEPKAGRESVGAAGLRQLRPAVELGNMPT